MTITDPSVHRSNEQARRRWLIAAAAVAVAAFALDQVSKLIIRAQLDPGDTWPEGWELIRITHVRNTGAAFGILQDATAMLTIASIVLSVAVVIAIYRLAGSRPWYTLCLGLVLGGALGNLIERLRLGHVTDFIDPMRYPSFNIADSSIVIGVVAMLVLSAFDGDEEPSTGVDDAERAASAEYEARG